MEVIASVPRSVLRPSGAPSRLSPPGR